MLTVFDEEKYIPKEESIKFFSWCNMMWGDDPHNTPKFHYFLVDEMMTSHTKFDAECFRGAAKSTIVSHRIPLYIATFGRFPNFGVVNNMCLLSDTFDQAESQKKTCMSYLDKSPVLQSFLKVERAVEGEVIFVNNKGHRTRMFTKGAGQAFRGANWEGFRPQFIIGDDILSDDIIYNKDLRKKLATWWVGTVENAVDISHYKELVIGTPMTEDDLLSSFQRSKQWHSVAIPVCKTFPVPLGSIQSNWKDRFTPERIMELYNNAKDIGEEATFYRELMLQTVSDDTRVFKKEWFKEFEYKKLKFEKSKYNFFTSMDLAATVKQSSDYTVIGTIAVNADGHRFVVRLDVGRYNPSEAIDVLFKHIRQFKPIEFRAEKAGIQQVLGHFIEEKMLKENTHFLMNYLELNSTTKKELRILSLQPLFKNRMIHFPTDVSIDEVEMMKHQILGFTKEGSTTGNDDIIDWLANFNDPNFIVLPSDYNTEYYEGVSLEAKDSTVF